MFLIHFYPKYGQSPFFIDFLPQLLNFWYGKEAEGKQSPDQCPGCLYPSPGIFIQAGGAREALAKTPMISDGIAVQRKLFNETRPAPNLNLMENSTRRGLKPRRNKSLWRGGQGGNLSARKVPPLKNPQKLDFQRFNIQAVFFDFIPQVLGRDSKQGRGAFLAAPGFGKGLHDQTFLGLP